MKKVTLGQEGWKEAIDDFLALKEATGASKTAKVYRYHLGYLRVWAEDQKISLQDFQGRHMTRYLKDRKTMIGDRGTPVSDRTRHADAVAAGTFFKFCVKEGFVTDNPLRDYEAPRFSRKQTPYPTEEQVREILRSFKRRFDPAKCDSARRVPRSRRRFALARNYALVTGLICTAARISEMCALKLVDYHPKELYIVFRNTKTDEDREVPITEDWVKIVDEFLKVRPRGCDADTLFVNEYGTVVKPTAFTMLWKDHLRWAGLPHFTLHSLRHFAATLLAERDLLAAKEILGHRRVETTMIYAHARRQHVRKVHQDTAALAAVLDEEPEEKPIERPILVNKRTERQKRRKLV